MPTSEDKQIFALEVSDLVGGYGAIDILKGVSLKVAQDEVVSIIGPNGAGKSTLMKAVFGMVRISSGSVHYQGEEITSISPNLLVQKGLGFVPQSHNVFPSMTVAENLAMGAFTRQDDYSQSLEEVYEHCPFLAEKKGQKAGSLSGGQQKMMAICMAMMLNPKLLLLDEPSAGLAPNLVAELMLDIQRIKQKGIAILMVEQNAKQALNISDRGYVLVTGRNEFEDSGAGLLTNPDIGRLYLGN